MCPSVCMLLAGGVQSGRHRDMIHQEEEPALQQPKEIMASSVELMVPQPLVCRVAQLSRLLVAALLSGMLLGGCGRKSSPPASTVLPGTAGPDFERQAVGGGSYQLSSLR